MNDLHLPHFSKLLVMLMYLTFKFLMQLKIKEEAKGREGGKGEEE